MASKTVSPVDIKIKVTGAEQLASLKSSFRDLSKQTKLSDISIVQAAKDIRNFAAEAGNSEATVRGQIKALEGLRQQAAMGGRMYKFLAAKIGDLGLAIKGSSTQIEEQRSALLEIGSAASSSSAQIKKAIDGLKQLRNQASQDSQAFFGLSKEIDELTKKVNSLDAALEQNASRNRARAASVSGILAKYEATARKQAQAAKEREEIVRGEVIALSEKGKATEELAKKENQLTAAIARRKQLGIQETAREARRSVRAGAQVYTGNVELGPIDALDQRLGDLPATTAAFSQRLTELQDRLINTVRSSDKYVAVALRISQVQREATATAQGLGAALVKDLASGNTVRNQKNLREAIGQLQAEMNELNTETAEGSSKYAENARQVNNLQKELDEIAGSYRNVTDMARQASAAQGVYANTSVGSNYLRRGIVRQQEAARAELGAAVRAGVASTPLLLPAAGQTSAPGTGLERSGGALPYIPESSRGFAQESFAKLQGPKQYLPGPALPPGFAEKLRRRNISEAESIRKLNEEKRVAKKLEEDLRSEVSKAKIANNDSVDSVNRLRSALDKQRNTLPRSSKAFKELSEEINALDIRSEKVSRRMSRRRFSPGKAAQVAGATISGGIFGGPEGFLGGAIGGALGGVGGSFAGAALGAQVGQLRQQLGGFAEYAASIEKLKIALNGIAGDASNYNRALQAASDVTRELNVPQEVAIRGITRLTAAVKGAGGGIADAELAFKNINSAIIATGGGAEQVEGAVTALVQIFSKGKVSAEEINQIAERLPGTFNKIAEASGRTGPELTKALQKGEVGLNDLMKFLVQLGGEYGELAEKIAGSSESAGARLTVAYNNMRIEIGKALQPIGAEFQEAFLEFITDIGPSLVVMAKAVGEGMRFILRNRAAIGTAAALAAKLFLVSKAMKLIASLKLATIASLAGTGTAAKITGDVSGVAAGKVALLGKALRSLAAIGIVTVGVEYVVNNARALTSNTEQLKDLRGRRKQGAAARFEGETYEGGLARQKAAQQTINAVDKEYSDLEKQVQVFEAVRGGSLFTRGMRKRLAVLKARRIEAYQNLSLPLAENPKKEAQTVFPGGDLLEETNSKSGGGGGGKAEKVRKSLLDSIADQGKLVFFTKERLKNELKIGEAQNKNNLLQVSELNSQQISVDFAEQAAQVELQYRDALRAAQGEKNEQAIVQEESLKREVATNKLLVELEGARASEAQRYRFEKEAIAKASEDELFNLRDQLGLVTNEQRIERFRQSRKDAGDPNAEQQTDLFRQTIDPTLTEGLSQNIRSLKKELEDLVNPINQITGAANAIGSAFSQSFTNAITGATSAKQALADFFKSVGSYFLDMAGQIIAKMVTIAILNTAVKLLPGGGGFNLESTSLGSGGGEVGGIGTLGPNFGIAQRAAGGPVTANEPYIVGERGIELMVPSTSGRVLSNSETRKQLNNQQAVASTREQLDRQRAVASTREQLNNQQAKAMQPLDIRYESTVINNVEYVTAEQHRKGMAQAAERGRAMTLTTLQNSPRTRSRVGI